MKQSPSSSTIAPSGGLGLSAALAVRQRKSKAILIMRKSISNEVNHSAEFKPKEVASSRPPMNAPASLGVPSSGAWSVSHRAIP